MLNGYIKLFRRFAEWEWYSDVNTKVVFLHLLLKANHKPSKYQGHDVPCGSVVTGRVSLSTELGLTEKQIRIALQKLESTGEIARKRASKFSIISLINWDTYQSTSDSEGQQRASKGPAKGQQRATSEECKNVRMEEWKNNNNAHSRFDEFWKAYPRKKNKGHAEKAWKRIKMNDGLFSSLMKGLDCAKKSHDWLKDNGQYVPYPATWLNAKGWEDESNGEDQSERKIKVLN